MVVRAPCPRAKYFPIRPSRLVNTVYELKNLLFCDFARLPGVFFTARYWCTACPTCSALMGSLCQTTRKPKLKCTSSSNRLQFHSSLCISYLFTILFECSLLTLDQALGLIGEGWGRERVRSFPLPPTSSLSPLPHT